jgi:hypothetical protein
MKPFLKPISQKTLCELMLNSMIALYFVNSDSLDHIDSRKHSSFTIFNLFDGILVWCFDELEKPASLSSIFVLSYEKDESNSFVSF